MVGLIETRLLQSNDDWNFDSQTELKAVEPSATECPMIKVYASETLDYLVDEGVQIHGGYGYHQDDAVERAYRDPRINRIFECNQFITDQTEAAHRAILGFLNTQTGSTRLELWQRGMTCGCGFSQHFRQGEDIVLNEDAVTT